MLVYVLTWPCSMVKSKTGSGKTLAYLLPVMHLLQQQRVKREDGTFGMLLLWPG